MAKMRLHAGGKKHRVSALIETMTVGETPDIPREDFKWKKGTPRGFIKP